MSKHSKAIQSDPSGKIVVELPRTYVDTLITLLQSALGEKAEKAPELPPALQSPANRRARALQGARAELESRRQRMQRFPPALFGEPAWDLLLLLYLRTAEREALSISQLAELTNTPLTTAIRWVDYLEDSGLLSRRRHQTDRRTVLVEATSRLQQRFEDYFSGAPGSADIAEPSAVQRSDEATLSS